MAYELPQIVRSAERLLLEIEKAVSRWPRIHRYTHGALLRQQAMSVAQLTHRAWRDRRRQIDWIEDLARAIDDLKLSLQLGKQIQAFASFAQFEMIARLAAETGRQCGGWLKRVHSKGQNAAEPRVPQQRTTILSSQVASSEAHP